MGTRGRVAWVVVLLVLGGCSSSPHPAPNGPLFDNGEVRFTAPTGWELRAGTVTHERFTRLVYLANQPLGDDCTISGNGMTCHAPLDALREDAMLVSWQVHSCVAQGCDLPPGTILRVGNRQGILGTPPAESCGPIGATDRSAYYVTVTPQRVDILFVCARNATEATKAALLGFLDAIVWRVP